MAKIAPASVLPAVAGEAGNEIIQLAPAPAAQLTAHGGFILIEPMAHGNAHFQSGAFYLFSNPYRAFQCIGNRFFGKDMQPVFYRQVNDLLMMVRCYDIDAEIRRTFFESGFGVSITLAFGKRKKFFCAGKCRGVFIHCGYDFYCAVGDIGRQEFFTPPFAPGTGPY